MEKDSILGGFVKKTEETIIQDVLREPLGALVELVKSGAEPDLKFWGRLLASDINEEVTRFHAGPRPPSNPRSRNGG